MFTLESDLQDPEAFTQLVGWVLDLNYTVRLVPEKCGSKLGCRNLICIPAERVAQGSFAQAEKAGSVLVNRSFLADMLALHCGQAAVRAGCKACGAHTCVPSWWRLRYGATTWRHTRLSIQSHCEFVPPNLC